MVAQGKREGTPPWEAVGSPMQTDSQGHGGTKLNNPGIADSHVFLQDRSVVRNIC